MARPPASSGLLASFHPNAFPPGLCATPTPGPLLSPAGRTNGGLEFAKQTSCFLQDALPDGPRTRPELLTHCKCKNAQGPLARPVGKQGAWGWGREGGGLGVGHASRKGPGADADPTFSQPFVLLLFQTSWSPPQPSRPSSHIGPTSAGPAPDQRLLSWL